MNHHSDPFRGLAFELFAGLPLPPLFTGFLNSRENLKGMPHHINKHLASNEWFELRIAMLNIEMSPFSENKEIMEELFNQIVIPQKHWKALQRGQSEHSNVLEVIEAITIHADKDAAVKNLSKYNGIEILCKIITSQSRSEGEKLVCLNTIKALLRRTEDVEHVRQILPLVKQVFKMIKLPKANCEIVQIGIDVIHAVCCCCNSNSLLIEIFSSSSSEVVPFMVSAFKRGQEQKGSQIENGLSIWNTTLKVISMFLKKAKSVKVCKDDLSTVIKTTLKIIHSSAAVDSVEQKQPKFSCVEAAVVVLGLLIDDTDKDKNMIIIRGLGVVEAVIKAILFVCRDKELRDRCLQFDMMGNSILIIGQMIDIEIDTKVIAPAFSALSAFFAFTGYPEHYASNVALICLKAVKKASRNDVKHLLSQGMMPLLATLYDDLNNGKMMVLLLSTLYEVVLKVPETDKFSHFKERLFSTLLYHYWHPITCEFNTKDDEIDNMCAYVLTAIGIACNYTDDERFKFLHKYFHFNFERIETGKIPIKMLYPGSFLIKQMAKVNCFKSNVLPHIWYITEHGPDELIKVLFESLPDVEEHTKVSTLEEMKEQILKYVLVEVKAAIERKSEHEDGTIITITRFLTSIPCTEQADIILYQLEDLVSPCLGLLEDQKNKMIIENVKKFIKNLHYS